MDSLEEMRINFNAKLNKIVEKKQKNTQIFTKKAYIEMIEKIELTKTMSTGKKPGDYARLKKYDVIFENGEKRIIVPITSGNLLIKPTTYFIYIEEIFDILWEVHFKTNHGGRNRMSDKLKQYKNITREMIALFISVCATCEEKRGKMLAKCIPNHAIFMRKSYFDFIEMKEEDGFKYMFIHEDCQTKFVQLRPSKTNSAVEAGNFLVDIFSIFGPSQSICSGRGQSFCEEVITQLYLLWPMLRKHNIKYFESSYVLEGTANIVNEILTTWLLSSEKNKWVKLLKMVQLTKNEFYDTDLQFTPYRAMFKGENYTDGGIMMEGKALNSNSGSERDGLTEDYSALCKEEDQRTAIKMEYESDSEDFSKNHLETADGEAIASSSLKPEIIKIEPDIETSTMIEANFIFEHTMKVETDAETKNQ